MSELFGNHTSIDMIQFYIELPNRSNIRMTENLEETGIEVIHSG